MRMAFDLRLLRCALAVAEHRNFARAARSMHVTQPTMSRSIQELEAISGTRLFDRSTNGVQATDAGLRFLKHAQELLSRSDDLEREMNLLKGLEKGELRIAAGTFPSHMFVDRALAHFIREHPSVPISVVSENWGAILPLLRRREVDLAILDVTAIENDPEMHIMKLKNHQAYLVMRQGHPVLKLDGEQRLDQTWTYPFVTTARFPSDVFKRLAEVFMSARIPGMQQAGVMSAVTCESLPMMKEIVKASDAITILPLNVVFDDALAGKLVAIPAPDWVRANFGIAHLAHRSLSPVGEEFTRMVTHADEELLRWEKKNAHLVLKKAR